MSAMVFCERPDRAGRCLAGLLGHARRDRRRGLVGAVRGGAV